MPLHVGEELLFDGELGQVVAVTDATDEDGRGEVEYGGHTFAFRALRATVAGVDYPLVASVDAVFRIGVVQQRAEPALFCLVLDDGPAPWGWGRRVVGKPGWAPAGSWAEPDAARFVMGWTPGTVTVQKGGAAQAGVYADLVLTYATSDGAQVAWWQPAYPSQAGATWGAYEGRFLTDDDGVLWDVSTGVPQPIIVPRGFGALGYRSEKQDGWPDCPAAERALTRLEVWYLQERAELREGASTTLNVAACELTVTGPVGATIIAYWEGAQRRAAHTIPIGGSRTLTGLPPGQYTVAAFHATDVTKEVSRQSVTLAESGATGSVALGSWVDHSGASTILVRAYLDGSAERAAGAAVWKRRGAPSVWEQAGTTDANGECAVSMTGGVTQLRIIDDRGCAVSNQVLSAGGVWDPQLTYRIGVCRSAAWPPQPAYTEGLLPWGSAGVHRNLQLAGPPAFLVNETTGARYAFAAATQGNGYVSDPLPHTVLDLSGTTIPDSARQSYELRDTDGTLLSSGWQMWPTEDPPWSPGGPEWWQALTEGRPVYGSVGGKILGNVVEASRGDLITPDNLAEAARMGLETGRFTQPLELRGTSVWLMEAFTGEDAGATTFAAWECPYCGGPAWAEPDAGGYQRGYCTPCAANGYLVDCRTAFLTRTLAAVDDWQLRVVRNTTAGGYNDRLVAGWPRPCEYYETDDYLIDPWVDGLPRWVAVHLLLGTWDGSTFVDGESVADAEARLGQTLGPVQLKLLLTADYVGSGKCVRVIATNAYTGQADALEVAVPPGAVAGDILPLRWASHDAYPGARNWYTDVTHAEEVAGDGHLACVIVNDGPSWRSSIGVLVAHHTASPWACDPRLSSRDPFLVEDFAGRVHLVYLREGRLLYRLLEGLNAAWTDPRDVSLRAHWPHPCREPGLAPLPHAGLLVAADSRGATRLFRSRDDGERWS